MACRLLFSGPRPGEGRRQECNYETFMHFRLVSHSSRALRVDDIPIHSICAVAGALVRFLLCIAVAVEDRIHENVAYNQFRQTF